MIRDNLRPDRPQLILKNFWIDIINDFIKPAHVKMQQNLILVNSIFDAIKTKNFAKVEDFIRKNGIEVIHARDSNGFTTLHHAALHGSHEIIQYLHENSVSDYITNDTEQKPIHWAAIKGEIEIVNYYIQQGNDINIKDSKGNTPLILASQYNQIPLIIYLIGKGALIDMEDNNGNNALHWAAYKGLPEIIAVLIYFGLSAKRCDNYGQTALHLACINGNLDAVKQLLTHVDLNARDNQGKTALDLARTRNNSNVVDLLERFKTKSIYQMCDLNTLCFGSVGNSKSIFYVTHLLLLVIQYPTYLYYGIPQTYPEFYYTHVIYWLINVLMWICYYGAHLIEPGYLRVDSVDYHIELRRITFHSNCKSFQELKTTLSRLCHTCKLVRPLRTSHCRCCNRCVLAFDHHCPYIQNCVGYTNRVWFFAFTFFVTCMSILNLTFCFIVLSRDVYFYWGWVVTLIAFSFLCMGAYLFGFAVYLASVNLTTNEFAKCKKYDYLRDSKGNFKNIFNRGFMYNWNYYLHKVPASTLELTSYEYSPQNYHI